MSNRILRLPWLLLVFAIAAPTMAQQVSEQAALEKARAFFQQSITASGQTIRRAPRKTPRLKAAVAGSEYYIFNDEANQDFVIISGDERTPDILGYSDEGCYNTQDVPEGLAELLDGYAEEIRAIQAGTASPRRAPANEFDAIEPLLTSSWGQSSPYNLMCPLQSGSHCLTGCVATAMAQVMYYHKWPKTLPVDIPAHPYRDDLPAIPAGTAFDWDSMLDSYDNSATTTQQNAVALLMLACGQACKASYGLYATSASTIEAFNGLMNYMGYRGSVYAYRDRYRSSDWDQLIYDELKGGRPVFYRGEHASAGGHAFVCDGYSSDRFFHFNFGWYGGSNGYYLLALSEPGAGTSFSGGQAALIGVQSNNLPAVTPTVQPSAASGSYQDLTINSWTLPSAFERDQTSEVTLNITNNGDVFFRDISLICPLASPVSTKGDFDAGETREDTYSFTPLRSGKTRILLASDNSGTEVVGQSDEFEIALGKEEVCYLYNPAADLYFCAGNLYGTHASLGEAGLDVALIGSKNTYKIETQVCNSGVKHYLGKDFYVDQEAAQWTFTYGDDGTFCMSIDGKNYLAYDGSSRDLTTTTNPNATGARWQKRSREEIITLMKQATQSKPVDATCLIGGGDFGRADRRGLQWANGAMGAGDNQNCHAEKSGKAFDTYRVIEGLPNGTYKVRVQAFYREDQPANTATLYQSGQHHLYSVFYANNVSTPVQSIFAEADKRIEGISTSAGVVPYYSSHVSTWFSDDLYWNELTVTVTDGTLRLGIRNSQSLAADWTCFDSFRLTYYGNGTTPTPASCAITTTAYPTDGGSVTGQGTYKEGQTVVLKATPANDNIFRGWKENGKIVSDSETYSFVATANRQLQAVFIDPIFQGFSNTTLYTLTCQRDELVPDANGLTLATGQTRPDATEAEKQFAIITVHGAHYLYSPYYKKYVASFGYLHDDLGVPIKFDDSHADGDYKYMLSFIYNDLTYYINCRSNGNIVYGTYNTPDAGNLWKIEEAGDFDPTEALAVAEQWSDVTFEVEFNGAVIATEKTTVKTGNAMPSVPTSLTSDFLTLTPVGTLPTTITHDVTARYHATWTGPFQFTTSMTDATWYNMNIRSGYWVGKQDSEPYYPSAVDEATLRKPEYQWAFGGDPYHVKVYNRSTGLKETLTNDGENVVMREGDDSWDLLSNSDGFILRKTGTTYKCINQRHRRPTAILEQQ